MIATAHRPEPASHWLSGASPNPAWLRHHSDYVHSVLSRTKLGVTDQSRLLVFFRDLASVLLEIGTEACQCYDLLAFVYLACHCLYACCVLSACDVVLLRALQV